MNEYIPPSLNGLIEDGDVVFYFLVSPRLKKCLI